MSEIYELTKELCALFGPSGCEDEVRARIRALAEPFADEIIQDGMGNLLVFKKGEEAPRSPFLLAAHMDEVGFIIKRIDADGMLRFGFAGGVDRRVAIGRRVLVGPSRSPGVIGVKAVHLTEPDERKTVPKTHELYIDVGAFSAEEARRLVSPGDYGVFDSEWFDMAGGLFKGRAIDDRFGCALMLLLLRDELAFDTWFAFTVQEEVGLRGAKIAAYTIKPGCAVVIETTTAADLPDTPAHMRVCSLNGGPVISFMDNGTIYDEALITELRNTAEENGITWQGKTLVSGGNDAAAFQRSESGGRVAHVSLPVRYLHSPASAASRADAENMLKLMRAFMGRLFVLPDMLY